MAAMEYDVFREIVGASITTLDATNYNNATKIVSTNGLLPGSNEYNGEYNYPYAIGIKTGHTSVAGYNLVSAANKDGVEILTVVMGCVTRESSFAQTVKLFDWTYENYETLTWNWTTHEDHDTPEALKEAPEYEKPEIAVTEGPEVVEFIPVEPDSAEYSATESPNTSFQKESPADSQQGQPTASLFSRLQSQGYMGAVIILGITVLLLIILVIILIVILSNRRKARRRKRRKR